MSDLPPNAEPLGEPLQGRCLCGAVTITLESARPLVDVCHCAMCRRWGGGPFGGVSGEAFRLSGEENVAAYRSSDWAERAFCARCGSNLWYRFRPADHYSFLAGLFDLPESFAMWRQIFIDEKPTWYDFAQDTPTMTAAEVVEEAKAKGWDLSGE
ncbi:MAG TPA: GFA family protein [Allosphingosinicella sp.]|jgi:hypothetical protein